MAAQCDEDAYFEVQRAFERLFLDDVDADFIVACWARCLTLLRVCGHAFPLFSWEVIALQSLSCSPDPDARFQPW